MAGAQAELSGIAHRLAAAYPASNAGRDVVVRDLRASLVGDVRPALLMVLIAAGLVLVIVCANVAGLLLTRALARSHDVAVRTALGASRGRLVRAALVESVLLGIAGGGVGLVLAWIGARGIATLDVSLGIPRMATTRVDGVVVAVTAAVSVLSAAVFGVAPAWRAMAFADVARRVRAAGPRFSRSRGRSALVIAEVAVALVLVVGALTLVRSFARLTSVDLGFEASEHVQTFALTLPDARYGAVADREQFIDRLLTRLRGLPGVQSAGAVFGLPLTSFGYSISVFERDGVSVPDTPEDMILLGCGRRRPTTSGRWARRCGAAGTSQRATDPPVPRSSSSTSRPRRCCGRTSIRSAGT